MKTTEYLEAFEAASRLYTKFDCPVAYQNLTRLVTARDCETVLSYFIST